MHVRVCPECDEEYRPDIAVCADCGADLMDRQLDESGREVDPEPVAPEPGVPALALFSGSAAGLKTLADALVQSGVPFQLVAPDDRSGLSRVELTRLALVVPETEARRALATLAPFRGRGAELDVAELVTTWGGDQEGDPPCPACGAHVPAEATACFECGLELGGSEEP